MNNKFRFHLCLVCIVVFAVAGCKVKRPGGVIPESEMENLLYDYHLAKSMGDNLPYSENYKKALYLDAVFRKHGTTQNSSLCCGTCYQADQSRYPPGRSGGC